MKSCCNGWRRTAKVSRSGTRGVPSRCFPAIPCWTWFVKGTRNRTPLPLPQKYPTQRALTCYTGFPSTTSLTKSSSTFFLWQQATVRTACIDFRSIVGNFTGQLLSKTGLSVSFIANPRDSPLHPARKSCNLQDSPFIHFYSLRFLFHWYTMLYQFLLVSIGVIGTLLAL